VYKGVSLNMRCSESQSVKSNSKSGNQADETFDHVIEQLELLQFRYRVECIK
jgi:hypothetical protein